jgi:hypothetical protein
MIIFNNFVKRIIIMKINNTEYDIKLLKDNMKKSLMFDSHHSSNK